MAGFAAGRGDAARRRRVRTALLEAPVAVVGRGWPMELSTGAAARLETLAVGEQPVAIDSATTASIDIARLGTMNVLSEQPGDIERDGVRQAPAATRPGLNACPGPGAAIARGGLDAGRRRH